MPFGSTGTFTDEEWANGRGRATDWETFVARDVVRAIDARFRTIAGRSGAWNRRPLGGRLRGGQHRYPSSGRVRARRELVGLRERRRHPLDLRGPTNLAPLQHAAHTLSRRRVAPPRTRSSGSTAAATTVPRQNAGIRPRAHRARGSRTASSFAAATTGRSGAATLPTPISPLRGISMLGVSSPSPRRPCSSSGDHGLALPRPPRRPPGPEVGEALPLDELSRRSRCRSSGSSPSGSRPGSCSGAGPLGAARAPERSAPARARRRPAVLRHGGSRSRSPGRSPARDALHVAERLQAVYLPAALVGLRVALSAAAAACRRLARDRRAARRGSRRSTCCTRPARATPRLLRSLTPDAVGSLARAAGVSRGSRCSSPRAVLRAGVAAPGRWPSRSRRSRRPARAPRAQRRALVSAVVLILLVARRHDFDRPGDAADALAVVTRRLVAVGRDRRLRLRRALGEPLGRRPAFTLRLRAARDRRRAPRPPHRTARPTSPAVRALVPALLFLLGVGATAWIVAGWLALAPPRAPGSARAGQLARARPHAWGADTLAPFVLRRDKSYFFAEEHAFLAYRVVGGVAIVSGDPVGQPASFGDAGRALRRARARARLAHRDPRRVGALARSLPRHGLHALYHGDEAVVDVSAFSLEGRAIRKVRQSVHRLERAGYTLAVLRPARSTTLRGSSRPSRATGAQASPSAGS